MQNALLAYTISTLRILANIFPIIGMGFLVYLRVQQNTRADVNIDNLSVAKSHFLKPACIRQPGFFACASVS
jgi:hypothetical protein